MTSEIDVIRPVARATSLAGILDGEDKQDAMTSWILALRSSVKRKTPCRVSITKPRNWTTWEVVIDTYRMRALSLL